MMETRITDGGWKRVQTTHYVVDKVVCNFFERDRWVKFTTKNYPNETPICASRFRCECCRISWEDQECDFIHLAFMRSRHKNQCICDTCKDKLANAGVTITIRRQTRKNNESLHT